MKIREICDNICQEWSTLGDATQKRRFNLEVCFLLKYLTMFKRVYNIEQVLYISSVLGINLFNFVY